MAKLLKTPLSQHRRRAEAQAELASQGRASGLQLSCIPHSLVNTRELSEVITTGILVPSGRTNDWKIPRAWFWLLSYASAKTAVRCTCPFTSTLMVAMPVQSLLTVKVPLI